MIQTSQTPRIRFCRQNVDTLDNPQVISVSAPSFNICFNVKIQLLIQTKNLRFGSKIDFLGFQNPAHKISEQSTFKWKTAIILTNTLFRHIRGRYFYDPDRTIHQTLVFEYVLKRPFRKCTLLPLPAFQMKMWKMTDFMTLTTPA